LPTRVLAITPGWMCTDSVPAIGPPPDTTVTVPGAHLVDADFGTGLISSRVTLGPYSLVAGAARRTLKTGKTQDEGLNIILPFGMDSAFVRATFRQSAGLSNTNQQSLLQFRGDIVPSRAPLRTPLGSMRWNTGFPNPIPNSIRLDPDANNGTAVTVTSPNPVGLQDGAWHEYELGVNTITGVSTLWIDGVQVATLTATPTGQQIQDMRIGHKFFDISGPAPRYVEWGRITVDTTRVVWP